MTEHSVIKPLKFHSDAAITPATGVALRGHELVDALGLGRYRLNRSGAVALRLLQNGNSLREASKTIAGEAGVPADRVEADLRLLMAGLDSFALVEVRNPSATTRLVAAARRWQSNRRASRGGRRRSNPARYRHPQDLVLRVMAAAQRFVDAPAARRPAHRFPGTADGVARAVLYASRSLILAGALCVPALVCAALLVSSALGGPSPAHPTAELLKPVTVTALFVAAAALHEFGHLAAMSLLRVRLLFVTSRGWGVSLRHRAAAPLAEAVIGAAGPLAAVAGCAVAWIALVGVAATIGLTANDGTALLLIAALHLISLGPWSPDGRAVWSAFRRSGRQVAGAEHALPATEGEGRLP
jgi:hypothetical protein